jgi:septal ring factor EnvC (AmiA/AmiB activator)
MAASAALEGIGLGEVARIAVKVLQTVKTALENKIKQLASKSNDITSAIQNYDSDVKQKRTEEQAQVTEKDQLDGALNTLRGERQRLDDDKHNVEQELTSLASENRRLEVTAKNLQGFKKVTSFLSLLLDCILTRPRAAIGKGGKSASEGVRLVAHEVGTDPTLD